MFSVYSLCQLFADVFNLFFTYSKIESMWSILEVVCMWVWVCLKPPASKHTWQQKIVLSGEEKKGPHSYRLSQKNTGEDDIFFPFFFCLFIFLRSHFVSNMRVCHCPSSKISGWHWPDFTVFFLLFHPPPPPPAAALRPLALPHNTGSVQ